MYLCNYNVSIDGADKYRIQGECDCDVLPRQNHWIAAQHHTAMTTRDYWRCAVRDGFKHTAMTAFMYNTCLTDR